MDGNTEVRLSVSNDESIAADWLVGGGELGERIRTMDWSATLGPRDAWPQSLRSAVTLMLASSYPMAILWGSDLIFLCNDAFRSIAGDNHPKALGRPVRQVWAEVWPLRQSILERVTASGETVHLDDQLFRIARDGRMEDAYFTVSSSRLRDESSQIAGTLVVLLETTRRVLLERRLTEANERLEAQVAAQTRAEEALRGSEKRYRQLVETLQEGIWAIDKDGFTTFVNPHMAAMLGYTAEEMHGKHLFTFMDQRGSEIARRLLERRARGVKEQIEFEFLRKDGSRMLATLDTGPLTDVSGEYIGAIAGVEDITERRQAEEALRESERRWKFAVEGTGAGVLDWDIPTGGMHFSDRWLVMTGYSRDDLPPRVESLTALIHPEDLPLALADVQEVMKGRKAVHVFEHRLKHKQGHWIWVEARSMVSAWSEQGEPLRMIGTHCDITERKRDEEALREADRRKDEFLAVLSHELRNPLTPIRSSLFILERADPGSGQARKAQAVIGRQVTHLVRLIDDLLDITRITRGKIQLQRERFELGEAVRRGLDDYRADFEARGVRLEGRFGSEPIWIHGDVTRVAQVVANLLANAAKFTPAGEVEISLHREGPIAVLRVRDTGVGIAPEMLEELFQPFTQAPQTLDRTHGGLGLGLALVKGLVELHGGSVGVTSDGPGRGAEFTVRLPLEGVEARADAPPEGSQPSAHPRRVLVIEDNADAADSLKELLQFGGHQVRVAFDGPSGLALAQEFRPEVVLCDIGLPGMSGYDVARRLGADGILRDAVLVALTGYALPEDKQRAAEAGFTHHITKPPSFPDIEAVLMSESRRS